MQLSYDTLILAYSPWRFYPLAVLLLAVPVCIANAIPVIVRHVPLLGTPIRRAGLGTNKTRRGLIFGTIAGTVSGGFLFSWYANIIIASEILHTRVSGTGTGMQFPGRIFGFSPFLIAFFLSFGALFGDSVKSRYKRRHQVPSGESWMPRDQIDYILGAVLCTIWYINWSVLGVLTLSLFGGILSIGAHYFAYCLGIINTKK